jgi:hypothetical protein
VIDITTTATLRSEILDRTLKSFKENLFKDYPCRLIINIDPVGDDTVENVLKVAHKYFGNMVNYRIAATPNFSKAFKWVFSETWSDYVFNLEDDWELLHEVDLDDMIRIMDEHPKMAALRLPYRISEELSKNWNVFFDFNGEFFECPPDKRVDAGFCGHPSLIRGDFIRHCINFIPFHKNPEKQFHSGGPFGIKSEVLKYTYALYQKQHAPETIKDIGRNWLATKNWRKKGVKAFFNEWEKFDPQGETI